MTNEKKLKALIVEKGFTQVMIAKMLGMSFQSLNNKLSNKTEFKSEEIKKLAAILKIKDKDVYFFANCADK